MELKFSTQLTPGTVVVIKTTAGDELIGRITEVNDTEITLERVLKSVMQMAENGRMAPGLMQYYVSVPLEENTVVFQRSTIASQLKHVPQGLEAMYVRSTTKIDLNTGSQILNG